MIAMSNHTQETDLWHPIFYKKLNFNNFRENHRFKSQLKKQKYSNKLSRICIV